MKKALSGLFVLIALFFLALVLIWLFERTQSYFPIYLLFVAFMFLTPYLMSDGVNYVKKLPEKEVNDIQGILPQYKPWRLRLATVEAFFFIWLLLPAAIAISLNVVMYFGWIIIAITVAIILANRKYYLDIGWSKGKYALLHFSVMTSLCAVAIVIRILVKTYAVE